MSNFIKSNRTVFLLAVLSTAFYASFGYDLVRSDFVKLITLYTALFFLAFKIIQISKGHFWILAGLGVLFRLIFISSIPNLSQDFYRFLWDGRLLIEGISPYLSTPELYMQSATEIVPQATVLFAGMGELNASHYSNYPPLNQLFFAIAAWFAKNSILGSVIVLKLILLLADVGILYFGKKLLTVLGLPAKAIFWYFLNPFIIVELSGNLHFEGIMLFFVVWSLYLLYKGKWFWAAVLLGISVSVKLIPLLFLPLFYQWFVKNNSFGSGFKRLISFYLVVLSVSALSFLPFISSEFISNFSSTIALWFQNFEFNASIYYVIRWIGFQTVGWNVIETAGKILPLLVITFILALTFFRKCNHPEDPKSSLKHLISLMLFCITFYFLMSTTVHPWYIATPLLLSVFTMYKFPIVWSLFVMLSYSAYGSAGFSENLWLVAIEYITVIGFAVWELIQNKPRFQKPISHLKST
jgi:hypothetical protein